MPTPIYNMMNGNGNNPMNAFIQFMQQRKGQNPNQILQSLISSGKLNQQQLNAFQQQANQIKGIFDPLKGMFGFK